jgi:hypothetical protein
MDTRSRARLGIALVISLAAVALAVLGLATVYGFAVEYGGGSFADLAFLVVPIPVLVGAIAVVVWPGVRTSTQVGVVLGSVVVMVVGGLAADALGKDESRDRLVETSRTFTCNGPNAELRLPAEVDQTWQELPRRAPIYGPLGGTPTSCTAGVSGDGDQGFSAYTAAFRDLDGWQVQQDGESRFVMARDDVRVTVRKERPGQVTTIDVAVIR